MVVPRGRNAVALYWTATASNSIVAASLRCGGSLNRPSEVRPAAHRPGADAQDLRGTLRGQDDLWLQFVSCLKDPFTSVFRAIFTLVVSEVGPGLLLHRQSGLTSSARSTPGIHTCKPRTAEVEPTNLTTTPLGWPLVLSFTVKHLPYSLSLPKSTGPVEKGARRSVLQSGLSSAGRFFCLPGICWGWNVQEGFFNSHFQHFSWNGWNSGGWLGSPVSPCGLFIRVAGPLYQVTQDVKRQCPKRTNLSIQALVKPLLVSLLLMSHWPKQVTWPIPELICEGL
ncbi:uncharacterized protein LOC124250600 [Equus quagga]|uniref:uncharacterized protein LOC124250600 n=1 Tax=Equus quagga TaxID=89248 RepID=UPI001EE282CD|nr:uncharacterized protein LOC124250600 [Equus quagga]